MQDVTYSEKLADSLVNRQEDMKPDGFLLQNLAP